MSTPSRIVPAGIAYFGLVFGAGFVLGAIRVSLLVPRLGERVAELMGPSCRHLGRSGLRSLIFQRHVAIS